MDEIESLVEEATTNHRKRAGPLCWRKAIKGEVLAFIERLEARELPYEAVDWEHVADILREKVSPDAPNAHTLRNHYKGRCVCGR